VCVCVCSYVVMSLFESGMRYNKLVSQSDQKHLQKCFIAVDFPRLCHARKNVVQMFYSTCNHGLIMITNVILKTDKYQ